MPAKNQLFRNLPKFALQLSVGIAGVVPVCAGLAGMLMGPTLVHEASVLGPGFDSHYRYLSGLLFGIGIAFWSTIPHIEKKGKTFLMLAAIVFVGGLARLKSWYVFGMPDLPMQMALMMELVVTPLLAFWQHIISKTYKG